MEKHSLELLKGMMPSAVGDSGIQNAHTKDRNNTWPTYKSFKRSVEKEYIQKVLAHTQGNITEAARILQLDRSFLHQKIKQFGIPVDKS